MQTLAHLCDAYLADTRGVQAASTHYNRACFCRRLLRDFGDVPLATLTPDRLRTWKQHLLAHYRPSTVHKYMVMLQTLLRYGVELGWLDADPLAQVRKPSPGRGSLRCLAPEERVRLLAACRASRNPLLYPLVLLALTTGGRKEELRTLQWPQVDLDAGVLRFLTTKNGQARSVPVVGEALAILQEMARYRHPTCPWVFPAWNSAGPVALTSAWETARAKAKLVDFRFHDLRHTFASYLAMSGASLREIAEALGHTNISLVLVYAHLTENHQRGVVERMARKFLEDQG